MSTKAIQSDKKDADYKKVIQNQTSRTIDRETIVIMNSYGCVLLAQFANNFSAAEVVAGSALQSLLWSWNQSQLHRQHSNCSRADKPNSNAKFQCQQFRDSIANYIKKSVTMHYF